MLETSNKRRTMANKWKKGDDHKPEKGNEDKTATTEETWVESMMYALGMYF